MDKEVVCCCFSVELCIRSLFLWLCWWHGHQQ